jgi:hypothetical protein
MDDPMSDRKRRRSFCRSISAALALCIDVAFLAGTTGRCDLAGCDIAGGGSRPAVGTEIHPDNADKGQSVLESVCQIDLPKGTGIYDNTRSGRQVR